MSHLVYPIRQMSSRTPSTPSRDTETRSRTPATRVGKSKKGRRRLRRSHVVGGARCQSEARCRRREGRAPCGACCPRVYRWVVERRIKLCRDGKPISVILSTMMARKLISSSDGRPRRALTPSPSRTMASYRATNDRCCLTGRSCLLGGRKIRPSLREYLPADQAAGTSLTSRRSLEPIRC